MNYNGHELIERGKEKVWQRIALQNSIACNTTGLLTPGSISLPVTANLRIFKSYGAIAPYYPREIAIRPPESKCANNSRTSKCAPILIAIGARWSEGERENFQNFFRNPWKRSAWRVRRGGGERWIIGNVGQSSRWPVMEGIDSKGICLAREGVFDCTRRSFPDRSEIVRGMPIAENLDKSFPTSSTFF